MLSQARVLGAVGLDEVLVDAPGGLDRGVAIIGEEGLETLGLGIGEQAGPGQRGAPGPVEPVTRSAPPAVIARWMRRRHWSSLSPARDTR